MSPSATAAHRFELRIYYEDTDFSGFVYHARYLHFFERARTEALRAQGIDQRALFEAPDGPQNFVVHRAVQREPVWPQFSLLTGKKQGKCAN